MDPHLEIYEASTANSQDTQAGYQALNEEVAQLTNSLGRLWGGFRKQVRACTHYLQCAQSLTKYIGLVGTEYG
jgi:hypothetical protein